MAYIQRWHIKAFLVNVGLFFLWGITSGVSVQASLSRSVFYAIPVVFVLAGLKNMYSKISLVSPPVNEPEEGKSGDGVSDVSHEFKPLVGTRQSEELERMVAQDPKRAASIMQNFEEK